MILSDKELISGCLKNDHKSQKALFDKYVNSMKTLCLRYLGNEDDAEDVLQEGFILMYTKLEKFKFKGSFEGWLRKIMINIALRHLSRRKAIQTESIDDAYYIFDKDSDIISDLSQKELLELLLKLPNGYRVVFNMYVLEGYNHKEISEKLNIGESTSRSQLAKAKNTLRKLIAEING